MKTNTKSVRDHFKHHAAFYLLILTCLIWFNLYSQTIKFGQAYFGPKMSLEANNLRNIAVKPVMAQKNDQERPLSMKEWVLMKTSEAGLNREAVSCLIKNESNWRPFAIYDNPNGAGVDRGLFMFNSKWHKEISNEDAFDYKKATEHFIRIAKQDGNFHQWWGYVNNCQ